jgi:hypothetical protein
MLQSQDRTCTVEYPPDYCTVPSIILVVANHEVDIWASLRAGILQLNLLVRFFYNRKNYQFFPHFLPQKYIDPIQLSAEICGHFANSTLQCFTNYNRNPT